MVNREQTAEEIITEVVAQAEVLLKGACAWVG
jgi:hypothetical protein